jgi:hypothetical protein
MAKSTFQLNDFLSNVRRKDLARASRFEIVMSSASNKGSNRDISLLCEEAAIPGLISTFAPTKIGNWTEYRAQGVEFFGDNATLTFYCNTDWNVREYFEAWMGTTADIRSKEVGFYDDYTGEIDIYTLDRNDRRTGKWQLKEAWPRLLNLTPVSQASDAPVRVTMTFTYRYWTSDTLDNSPIGNIKRFVNLFKDGDSSGIAESLGF